MAAFPHYTSTYSSTSSGVIIIETRGTSDPLPLYWWPNESAPSDPEPTAKELRLRELFAWTRRAIVDAVALMLRARLRPLQLPAIPARVRVCSLAEAWRVRGPPN